MHKFDYSFLRNISVPVSFLELTNNLYKLREVEKNKEQAVKSVFKKLQQIAIIESVKSSNAIEGIITTDERIKAIINNNSKPLNHNEQEIAGYRDTLNLIHTNYQNIDFSERTIKTLHSLLLQYTTLDFRGEYKRRENIISERFPDGTINVRFHPVSVEDTPKAMEQLVLAYIQASNDTDINQLLLIPCIILDFLCIHPFQDGNGRISRLLSILLLYKNNFDISKYISFEEQINKNKNDYYEKLKFSSNGWNENQNTYIPFIENFIITLNNCYNQLNDRYLKIKDIKNKNKQIEEIIYNSLVPISKKEIADILIDVSVTTIELTLSKLLKNGKIIKIGTTNSAKYIKNNIL